MGISPATLIFSICTNYRTGHASIQYPKIEKYDKYNIDIAVITNVAIMQKHRKYKSWFPADMWIHIATPMQHFRVSITFTYILIGLSRTHWLINVMNDILSYNTGALVGLLLQIVLDFGE
jgi:hypothetical protein